MKYYAGIGMSDLKNIPQWAREEIHIIGKMLALEGYCLRSGAAYGCDQRFEQACDEVKGAKQIFLPWEGFSNHPSPLFQPSERARAFTLKYHPKPNFLSKRAKQFIDRDACQLFGVDCAEEAVKFVVCYTSDGVEDGRQTTPATGGTGQAIRIATAYNIPVVNIFNGGAVERVEQLIYDNETKSKPGSSFELI